MTDTIQGDMTAAELTELKTLAAESAAEFLADICDGCRAKLTPADTFAEGYRLIMRGDPDEPEWPELDDDVADATAGFESIGRDGEPKSITEAYIEGFSMAVMCLKWANAAAADKATG